MLDVMYEVPSRDDIKDCVITEQVVRDKVIPELQAKSNDDDKKQEAPNVL